MGVTPGNRAAGRRERGKSGMCAKKSPVDRHVPLPVADGDRGAKAWAGGGTRLAHPPTMSHIITRRRLLGVFEHMLAIVVGFILMVLGLGLSVTMIMLPVGLAVGLVGLAMFIAGMCVQFEWI